MATPYIEDYSRRAFVVRGKDLNQYKSVLKGLGGRWNPNLRGGDGMLFSRKKHYLSVNYFINNLRRKKILETERANASFANTVLSILYPLLGGIVVYVSACIWLKTDFSPLPCG